MELSGKTLYNTNMDTHYSAFLKVSAKTGIPIKKILDTFYVLRDGVSFDNNVLVRSIGLSKNAMNEVKGLFPSFFNPTSTNTQIRTKEIRTVQHLFDNDYISEEKSWEFLENNLYKKTLEIITKYKSLRPKPKRQYDQFFATENTTAKRASLLDFQGDLKGKNILFLGDDDMTSVACALSHEAERVVVLDVDTQILGAITEISNREKLRIEAWEYDVRKPLPSQFVNKFDIVFTDPPYTPTGASMFLSRAIAALDIQNKSARIYICYGTSDNAKERFLPIYELLTKSALMIRFIFDTFNRYVGAESIGSTSTLFVCEVTAKTKAQVSNKHDRHFYTTS